MPESTPLQLGDTIELDVTGIAHGGVSVARHDGRVVFVSDTLPGERVRAQVTDARKKSFARATTVDVLEASPDRRPHVWAEAATTRDPEDRVGGAEFGHIALERQRALKADVLRDALRRFGTLTDDEIDAVSGGQLTVDSIDAESIDADGAASDGLGWRTRVRLHVDSATGAVGPYAARSHRVIPVEHLPLAVENIGFIAPLGEMMPDVETVDLIAPSADDPRMLITPVGARHRTGEHDRVRELVGDREFLVRAGGFWQVHREAPRTLFEGVRDAAQALLDEGRMVPAAPNLDLYGGAGLLAAALAEAAGPTLKVTSVESDSEATDDAAENLAGLVGALAVTGRVDRYLADLVNAQASVRDRVRQATVVLDPPRSGAGGEVCERLGSLAPANLIYVACDPVALARDTATLREHGYSPVSLRALDLFPHTHHFEAIAVFVRE